MSLCALTSDILQEILGFLDGTALALVESVSRPLRALCKSYLWADLCGQWAWLVRGKPSFLTWKHFYCRLATRSHSSFTVVAGAYGGDNLGEGRRWRLRTREWEEVPEVPGMFKCAAVVRDLQGGLLVIGGLSDIGTLRSVHRICGHTREWGLMPPMGTPRCCAGAAALDSGDVMVVGGSESMWMVSRVFDSVEVYDARRGGWYPHVPLLEPRCAHGVTVTPRGHVYAVGGYRGEGVYLDSVHRLDTAEEGLGRGWERCPALPSPSVGNVAAVGPDQGLYVVGGGRNGNNNAQRSDLLRTDPRAPRGWDALRPMCVPRYYFAGAFGPDGWLYVAGGYTHSGQLSCAERYDPRADRWEVLPPMETGGRPLQFCAGVVSV